MKKIRIVSPAKHIEQKHLTYAQTFLQEKGFTVDLGEFAGGQHNYFSGTIEQRVADFQAALNDEDVNVILCSRGGYGCVQLLEHLDFSALKQHPKLIVGYSDVTVLHCHLTKHYNITTLHATAPLNFAANSPAALSSLVEALKLRPLSYTVEAHYSNLVGKATGHVIGGNLAILYSLIGTDSDPNYANKILFIEEIGEAYYSIDRMFYALKKSGKLSQLKGLIVGGMTNMKDSAVPYGSTAEEIILSHVSSLDIPVCFNFPVGHITDNRAIYVGKIAQLDVQPDGVRFSQ